MPKKNKHARQPQPDAVLRQKIIALAMQPGGFTKSHLHNKFDMVSRPDAQRVKAELIAAGLLAESHGIGVTRYCATLEAHAEHARMAPHMPPARKPPPPPNKPSAKLYHPSATKLPGIRQRFGAMPPPLPGGLVRGADPIRPQPTQVRTPGQPLLTQCPGWTHNHKYQIPPDAIVNGEFSRLGIGRYLDGATA